MKRILYFILTLFIAETSFSQGHFTVVWTGNGQDQMNITVFTATVGGIALEAGDEIAAFDGSICCGNSILESPIVSTESNTFAYIIVSRKDTGQLNGYTIGNPISYKFWDSDRNIEISAITAEYFGQTTGLPITAPIYSPVSLFLSIFLPVNR